ncbi:transposon Ty3-I Gag-Pol polyprotein [Trichonephila inaurata madagascariensis]|uniref:Transposon Ty3-I Gag-Pol polyprotein n=1 Tax=Trichonephila inaurata madagascariensis TaxID=2747483 RepID=A0A8X6MD44_9ARAC|nr:transposon Ty3-I Gag-Pol polyprotein [Trichonephila inaurata madagascariensis]
MGAVERWNHTLKNMLSKNVQELGSDWDIHLPFLLFAYREIPHSTKGMSPFQLVYRRLPSGPISLLKEVGERNIPTTVFRSVETYLEDLIEKLRAHEIASETAESRTSWIDFRSRLRFQGPSLCSDRYGYDIYGDCKELEDFQRQELLNALRKFSSFSSLPGLAKIKGHNLKLKPDFIPKKDATLPHTYCFAARSRLSDQ